MAEPFDTLMLVQERDTMLDQLRHRRDALPERAALAEIGRGRSHLDLRYLVLGSDVAPHPGPGESPEVAWFSWEAALDMADDSLTGGLRSARTLVRASAARAGVPQVDRREDS